MPIYVYRCDTCGLTFERRQRMTEAALVDCPECDGHVHRVIQPVGIVFKGSGFYVTDNRSRSATALPGKKDSKVESSSESADTDSAKTDNSAKATTEAKTKAEGD